jgi:uncharacterized protein
MRINLAEIPEEGRTYIWNSQTGELNALLADLVGKLPHHSEFFIKPLNSRDYELNGFIRTEMPEVCSRCGIDFDLKVNEKFRGILIPRQIDSRTGKYARVNHVSESLEEGPEVYEHDGNIFEMGEYLHEIVALAAPFNPVAPEDEKGDCSVCKIPVKGRLFSYDEEMPEEKPENPFSVLKNIKLN